MMKPRCRQARVLCERVFMTKLQRLRNRIVFSAMSCLTIFIASGYAIPASTSATSPAGEERQGEKYVIRPTTSQKSVLTGYAKQIAMDISSNLKGFDNNEDSRHECGPLIVMTFTDVNRLQTTLNFGRAMTDCVISSLQQQGFDVIELRTTNQIHMEQRNGEYFLSRKPDEVNKAKKFKVGLVGTYSIAYNRVIVNARLVETSEGSPGRVISSSSLEIPVTNNIIHLLTNTSKAGPQDRKIHIANDIQCLTDEADVSVFERRPDSGL